MTVNYQLTFLLGIAFGFFGHLIDIEGFIIPRLEMEYDCGVSGLKTKSRTFLGTAGGMTAYKFRYRISSDSILCLVKVCFNLAVINPGTVRSNSGTQTFVFIVVSVSTGDELHLTPRLSIWTESDMWYLTNIVI